MSSPEPVQVLWQPTIDLRIGSCMSLNSYVRENHDPRLKEIEAPGLLGFRTSLGPVWKPGIPSTH